MRFARADFFPKVEIGLLEQPFSRQFLLHAALRWVTAQRPFGPVFIVLIRTFSSVFSISSAQRRLQLRASICAASVAGFRLRKMLHDKPDKLLSSFSSFINLYLQKKFICWVILELPVTFFSKITTSTHIFHLTTPISKDVRTQRCVTEGGSSLYAAHISQQTQRIFGPGPRKVVNTGTDFSVHKIRHLEPIWSHFILGYYLSVFKTPGTFKK